MPHKTKKKQQLLQQKHKKRFPINPVRSKRKCLTSEENGTAIKNELYYTNTTKMI